MKYSKSTKTCMQVSESDDRSIEQALNFQRKESTKYTKLLQAIHISVTANLTAHSQYCSRRSSP